MSYPYGQFAGGENYSTPSTPHDAFPQWDTIEREQEQQSQQHQQQQQQGIVPSDLHSPIPGGYPTTIQLEDQPPVVPSHAHDDSPVRLHPVNQDPRSELSAKEAQAPSDQLLTRVPFGSSSVSQTQNKPAQLSLAPAGSTIIRSGRAQQHHQAQHQAHPYQRPSGTPRPGQQSQHQIQQHIQVFPVQPPHVTQREHHVHFAPAPSMTRQTSGGIVASAIPSSSSARGSPLVPSPSSRLTSFGSSLTGSPVNNPPLGSALLRSSPRTMDPPALPAFSGKPRSYVIRMDTHYDTDTHVLTAMLEVPGVRREHLSVRLSTCSYNRVKQITVNGVVHPPFGIPPLINVVQPPEGFTAPNKMSVRERKYGTCTRVLPVPSDLKREDIEANLQDGVLTLRFPCGIPAEEDGEDIVII